MPFVDWLVRSIRRRGHPEPVDLPGILSQSELRLIVERERARADRTFSPLSLVLIELRGAQLRSESPMQFPTLIARRLRCTDAIGWFEDGMLGIMLPDTRHDSAALLCDQLRAAFESELAGARWRILVYPENRFSGNGPQRGSRTSGRPSRGVPTADEQAESGARMAEREVALVSSGAEPEALRSVLVKRTSAAKRTLDVLGASLGLIALSPLMASAAVAVRLSSPGPIFFSQLRAGEDGRTFSFYKFRTMQADAEVRKQELMPFNEQSGPVFKIAVDPRITGVGRILRKTSIDELPQLWNVLIGDMSLVGPRPPIAAEVDDYEPWQRRRLEIRGGLTCIWQVSGRSAIQFDDWARMDLRYAKNNSLKQDLGILLRTIPAVLTGRGAH